MLDAFELSRGVEPVSADQLLWSAVGAAADAGARWLVTRLDHPALGRAGFAASDGRGRCLDVFALDRR